MRRLFTVVAAFAVCLGLVQPDATAAPAPPGFRAVDIPARDGVILKGNVFEPGTAGRHPAIVFAASWAANDLEYVAQAAKLAADGYVVVSYTPRGIFGSGGEADMVGPKDISDMSAALDWTVANTDADPGRLGVSGVSYGGDMALLAPATDKRIKAVAALSAYSDLEYSMYTNRTRRGPAIELLNLAGRAIGTRYSPELERVLEDFRNNRNIDEVQSFARKRSASTHVDEINRNAPAVLMANAFGDSFFPPNQLVTHFNALTGPKRLRLAPGDHAFVEATGLAGLPNEVWADVHRWFDRYLKGKDNGIDREDPIVLTPRGAFARPETYPTWPSRAKRFAVSDGATIAAGRDTTAGAGVPFVSNIADLLTGLPPTVSLPTVNRRRAVVGRTPAMKTAQRLRGIPRMRTSITPSTGTGTVIAYLYDVDRLGTGKLISHMPYTFRDATPGEKIDVDLPISANAWNIPAGHRVAAVIDTKDPLYSDAGERGSTMTFGPVELELELPLQ